MLISSAQVVPTTSLTLALFGKRTRQLFFLVMEFTSAPLSPSPLPSLGSALSLSRPPLLPFIVDRRRGVSLVNYASLSYKTLTPTHRLFSFVALSCSLEAEEFTCSLVCSASHCERVNLATTHSARLQRPSTRQIRAVSRQDFEFQHHTNTRAEGSLRVLGGPVSDLTGVDEI